MRKPLLLALAAGPALALSFIPAAAAKAPDLLLTFRIWEAERELEAMAEANVPPAQTLAYGHDPAQVLNFWPAVQPSSPTEKYPAEKYRDVRPASLIIYVHGGGWQHGSKDNATGRWKLAHFPQAGYAFASINYRLVPAAHVEDQAADVALALRALVDRAASLGIDPHRVVLMGHSAGAHLVSLVGTDERWLKGAGLSFANLAGVIPIDGAAYDVPAQMKDGPAIMQQTYRTAFGTAPARQRLLSPTL